MLPALVAGHERSMHVQVNVSLWAPGEASDGEAVVLFAAHSPGSPPPSRRRNAAGADWHHVLHVVGAKAGSGKDAAVADVQWYVQGASMRVWLAVAWVGGHLGLIDFSNGPLSPLWLWQHNVAKAPLGALQPPWALCLDQPFLTQCVCRLAGVCMHGAQAPRTAPRRA
jgi:hypothetical protein